MTSTLTDTAIAIAENVSAIEQEEIFYESAEFWVGFAFVVVVGLLVSPVGKAVRGMIHQRIERIKDELSKAENLKLDAQKLYAEYERKLLNAENEVAEIVENENAIISETKERHQQKMSAVLKQKNKEADIKIEMAFERANKEINTIISKKVMSLLQQAFLTKINKNEQQKLIDKSINNIEALNINEH